MKKARIDPATFDGVQFAAQYPSASEKFYAERNDAGDMFLVYPDEVGDSPSVSHVMKPAPVRPDKAIDRVVQGGTDSADISAVVGWIVQAAGV